jgi:hypothetical protein
MKKRLVRLAALQVLLLVGVAHLETANAASNIGVAAAAHNDVSGITGGGSHAVTPGTKIFQDEVIKTGAQSMAQLLFLDETSLSVGPQSEITLDKFIYNPSTGVGSVVLSATQGAFRFISGSQPSANYRINTAIATIGTRGTIVDCYLSEAGLYCIAQEGKSDGAVIITVNGVQHVLKPGQALFVSANKEVTGPMAPDDEFFAIVGKGPYPLYGGLLPGEHQQFDVPDDGTVRGDELFQHPDPCGGYGELKWPWEPRPLVRNASCCDINYYQNESNDIPPVLKASCCVGYQRPDNEDLAAPVVRVSGCNYGD